MNTDKGSTCFEHIPVLLDEVICGLNINPDGIYVDGTLGGGGHAEAVLEKLSPVGRLIGIDQDSDAINAAGDRLKKYKDRISIVQDNYANTPSILYELGIDHVDGIYLDLGVSSFQIDTPQRGFSYLKDAPLDMRMDQRNPRTAADLINNLSQQELYRIIRDYGEDRFAKNIARHIVEERKKKRITTTHELAEIVSHAIPKRIQASSAPPAMRTFQAVRIALNKELSVLTDSIDKMIGLLNDKGRFCVITFHSLEDRIVKEGFKRNENPCICPPDFPVCVCNRKSLGSVITKKPIIAGDEEREKNNRSRSAKLRIFERKIMK